MLQQTITRIPLPVQSRNRRLWNGHKSNCCFHWEDGGRCDGWVQSAIKKTPSCDHINNDNKSSCFLLFNMFQVQWLISPQAGSPTNGSTVRGLISFYCSTRQLIGQPEKERLPKMWVWVIRMSWVKCWRKWNFWFESNGAAEETALLVGQHVALLHCRLSCVWGWIQASFLQTEIQT